MKYLIVESGAGGEEKVLCADQGEAIEWVQNKLRGGCSESDIQVFSAEPVNFQVERMPVVTLNDAAANPDIAPVAEEPNVADFPSAAYSSFTSEDTNTDATPFSSEQVFSLDS